jgi:hypothetical protein
LVKLAFDLEMSFFHNIGAALNPIKAHFLENYIKTKRTGLHSSKTIELEMMLKYYKID